MKTTSYLIVLMVLFLTGCKKEEEKLTSTTTPEYGNYSLEGDAPHDQRIRDYYKRFGTFILYRFNKRDSYYNEIATSTSQWDSTYKVIPAEAAFVDQQLNLLDTTFFRYYQDSTLRKYLPVKLLLCSSIKRTTAQLDCYLTETSTQGFIKENFIVNWGSSRINNIHGAGAGQKDSAVIFRGNANYGFLRMMDLTFKMGQSAEFIALSDYTTSYAANTNKEKNKRGFIGAGIFAPPARVSDWHAYIQAAVQNPYTYLTDTNILPADSANFKGILTPAKDATGLIKRKYDAIINYYRTNYNIDLQRIGDGRP